MQSQYLKEALNAARGAGRILQKRFRTVQRAHSKGNNYRDLVTEADLASERYLVYRLNKAFPSHYIVSEEGSEAGRTGQYEWIIDPLDGTTNYAQGIRYCAISIALLRRDEPIVGVIYAPLLNDLYYAQQGKGAYENGERIHVSSTRSLAEAFCVVAWHKSSEAMAAGLQSLNLLMHRTKKLRVMGSTALNLAELAAGRYDLLLAHHMQWWDIVAGAFIVREAGGETMTGTNTPITHVTHDPLIATNGFLRQAALATLKKK